jgi:hypothetical protein
MYISPISPEEQRQALEIGMECTLKYGYGYKNSIEKIVPYWAGPLEENSRVIHSTLYRFAKEGKVRSALKEYEGDLPEPYTRDFFQGLADSVGKLSTRGSKDDPKKRIQFKNRPHVVRFLKGDEHNLPIVASGKIAPDGLFKTRMLPIFDIPCKGRTDKYLAGLLTGSTPYTDEEGLFWCRVTNPDENILKRMNIVVVKKGRKILISPFYLLLFCGDLPASIYSYWMGQLPTYSKYIGMASLLARIHWRLLYRHKNFKKDLLPFLHNPQYYGNVGLTKPVIFEHMRALNIDFVDRHVRERCERWKSLHENA